MDARSRGFSVIVALALFLSGIGTAHAKLSLGGGIHYLRTLGDISDDGAVDLNQDSFSLLASGMSDLGMLKIDGQVEYVFDYLGTGHEMWLPSAWLLAGRMIYGGAGIGIGYTDGDWQTNPFYALRAGVNVPLGKMALDGYASYNFQSDAELKNLTGEDLDSVTFAALLRF